MDNPSYPSFAFLDRQMVRWKEANVPLTTHALHYGTGCYEGIRAYWNEKKKKMFVFITPYPYMDILEGITLDTVLAIAKDIKVPMSVRPLNRSELFVADEVFICGTACANRVQS